MGGVAANRVTAAGSGILGTTLKAIGGEETHVLATGEVGQHSHVFITGPGSSHTHLVNMSTDFESAHTHGFTAVRSTFGTGVNQAGGLTGAVAASSGTTTGGTAHNHGIFNNTDPESSHTHPGTTNNNTGGGGAHQNMPPTIVCNKIIVAE